MSQGFSLPQKAAPPKPREGQAAPDTVVGLLHELTEGGEGQIHVRPLLDHLGSKGFGPVLLALGVPQLAPLPPGAPIIFALPLLIVCLQMIAGRETLWLPDWMERKGIDKAKLAPLVAKVIPWVERAERHMKPRMAFMVEGLGERIMGLMCTVIAIVLVLPVPFANFMPSLSITAFGLAMARKDGLVAAAGYVVAILAVLVIVVMCSAVGYGWNHYVHHLIGRLFS